MVYVLKPTKLPNYKVKNFWLEELGKEFDFDVKERLAVVSDLEMFRYKEDESVWKQAKSEDFEWFQIFFDGELCCEFSTDFRKYPADFIVMQFWKGFLEHYEKGNIQLNPHIDMESGKYDLENLIPSLKEEQTPTIAGKKLPKVKKRVNKFKEKRDRQVAEEKARLDNPQTEADIEARKIIEAIKEDDNG